MMKKYILILAFLFLTFFYSINSVNPTFCCWNETLGGRTCYTYGECCKKNTPDEYWHPVACFDFDVWVEPNSMLFNIGKKTAINLYIKNTGTYDDNYTIEYNVEGNPAIIQVDMVGVTPTGLIGIGEIKKLYPIITLFSDTTGRVIFNATSQGNSKVQRTADINVRGSLPISLPEFNNFYLIILIILTVILYFLSMKKRNYRKTK